MDETMQRRMDSIVEDEVRRGFRIKDVPENLIEALEAAHAADPTVSVFRKVRFTKLTPRKRRLINEAVVKRYHLDLKNPDILSNDQLRRLNIERGEWSAELERKLELLQEQTNQAMRELYLDGFDRREEWTKTVVEAAARVRIEIAESKAGEHRRQLTDDEKKEALERFTRWMDWSPEVQVEFDTKYASSQGRETYSPDNDQQWLLDRAPSLEFVDALNEIDDHRDKLRRYMELLGKRRELLELQVKQTKMFAESVEQRRDTAEEMARMYYCTEIASETDTGAGPIAKTVDGAWDLPDEVIQWLLVEIYFFLNGIPDEAREFLSQWGFIAAPRSSGSQPASAESPVEPTLSSGGVPVVEMAAPSSAPRPATTSEISSSV